MDAAQRGRSDRAGEVRGHIGTAEKQRGLAPRLET
jgi:hypothetical protein